MSTDIDVIIVGAGPVGLANANFLGQAGIKVLAIEQLDSLIDYPRAIGLDDESLRSFQSMGVAEEVLPYTTPFHWMRILTPSGKIFASFEPRTTEYGWSRRNAFNQPETDKRLFNKLSAYNNVEVRFGVAMESFDQDDESVSVNIKNADGSEETLRAQYMIACDGGNSYVRRTLGIDFEGKTAPNQWIVVDVKNDPIGTPHVYLCADPLRPYVSAALPLGIRRFEFMLVNDEKAEDFDSYDKMVDLMRKVVPNPDKVDVIRSRVYTHNARIAGSFRKGRIVLAGDAAHIMPVWQGQGYNSGIRDASNLSWKMAMVIKGQAKDTLLDTYQQERKDHAKAMIDLSVMTGNVLAPPKAWHGKVRDVVARLMDFIPPLKRYFLEMRFKPAPQFKKGAMVSTQAINKTSRVGKMFMQPTLLTQDGQKQKLDDIIGNNFAVIAWSTDPTYGMSEEQYGYWKDLGAKFIRILPDNQINHAVDTREGVITLGDMNSQLRDWFTGMADSILFLRPDRYIASMASPQSIDGISRQTLRVLSIDLDKLQGAQ